MNYIYDILVNFNEKELYEFYEWDKNDVIEHLRKVPIFKVNSKTLKDFINCNIKIDKFFLNRIKNKTEIFSNRLINYIEYCSIFTDSSSLIIIEFDEEGNSILKSSMLLDELEDTLDESEFYEEININYEILNKVTQDKYKTRNEKKILDYITKEINYLIKNKNYNKLKYLYFEWYAKKEDNIDKIIKELKEISSLEYNSKHTKLFDLIKLSNTKKQI